ncbi:MAG: BatA domain-containing protein [Bacteroidota bacterium]
MTFLNPFVLLGLAAAAIPLILHLLNIRKLRTIEFSTLTFLKELQKSKMRKVKIRQWLLLMLRTLIILFIVVAFSRPALKGTLAGFGTHAKTTIVIILDNSYSMSLRNERGTFLKQAQSSALGLVDMLKEGDDALFIRLSDLPQATIGEPTHDIQQLRDAIRRTDISYKHRTVEDALRLSSRLLQRSNNFNKEIYIVTDNQKTTVVNQRTPGGTGQTEKLFESNVRLFFVPLSDQPFENVGIEKVEIPPTLFQKGKPFTVRADVRNYGTAIAQNYLVNLFLDGARVMQKSVTIDGGKQAFVEFTATPNRAGFLSGRVKLEEDSFSGDNDRYFTINIPEQVNVLLSSSDPKSSTYIRLALTAHNEDEGATALALTELSPSQLTYGALVRTDVVLLSNVASLSPLQADQLNEYASQGGGIIIIPGNLLNVDQYNSSLLPKLGLPPLMPVEKQKTPGTYLSFEKIDFGHPVFQGMFESATEGEKEKKEVESPKVLAFIRFTSEKEIRSIISLSNGTPFLWEKISNRAAVEKDFPHILGFAVAGTSEWSDFPLKGIFVPLLYQTILYAASGGSSLIASPSVTVGDRIDIPLPMVSKRTHDSEGAQIPTLQVFDPERKETLVQPYSAQPASTVPHPGISFDKTSLPGIYSIVRARDTLMQIPVNVDPLESASERSKPAEVIAMIEKYGIEQKAVSIVKNPESLSKVVLQSRFGVELWNYFLIAAIITAVIEMVVAREPKPEMAQ